MAPNTGSSGNKGFAVASGDEIVALANDMMWLCNLVDGIGSTGCGKSSNGVCACAYRGATAAGKSGWHGMKASGQGANPTQIETNNWPITKGICDTRGKEGAKQNAEDISTHMIAALATLRTRLRPGNAATENPTNTYCLGQAGNQGCSATSTQQEACVCYAKATAEKTGGLPGWAPTAVEIAARMREAAQLESKIRSLSEEAHLPRRRHTSDGTNTWKHSRRLGKRLRETPKEETQRPATKQAATQGTHKVKTARQGPRLRETKAGKGKVHANVTERTRPGTKTQKRARTQQQRARLFGRQPHAWRS
ncbi:hypothetical protein, conserved in T. vivax [Trypanosoma vivax Y486]|uniref:Uncharacterized protein n=1 Tax=Trypanosoma vivax (strain Y486) TaxID=1055687 RepID=F9WQM0_TRYVY|nr:hypothetical protein, conserved in T. vivax [Trypanosoma vivax Y486]|eukprot:CCD19848.1 hypothetical protein, conserved in T. vivax [Trypanosoma vivax Y486]